MKEAKEQETLRPLLKTMITNYSKLTDNSHQSQVQNSYVEDDHSSTGFLMRRISKKASKMGTKPSNF